MTLAEEALGAISKKAIERKAGVRGLRSIMESILLDTMFDLPSLEGVEEAVISKQVVEGTAAAALHLCRSLRSYRRRGRERLSDELSIAVVQKIGQATRLSGLASNSSQRMGG